MSGNKRHFPWASGIDEGGGKKRSFGNTDAPIPGFSLNEGNEGTDFGTWTDAEIKDFLTRRGEDFDASATRLDLIALAKQCEQNTGPAQLPATGPQEDAEVDPLDAFMAEIDDQVKANEPNAARSIDGVGCDDIADPVADFLEARKTKGFNSAAVAASITGTGYNSDEEVYAAAKAVDASVDVEYDSDDNPIIKKKNIDPLAPLDHSKIDYDDFDKDFYEESKEIAAMSSDEVVKLRRSMELKVSGFDPPKPVLKFQQCGLGRNLLNVIKKQGFERPTPIQAQAVTVALSGRDVLGIAKTGSGKTAAFVLPMVVHIMAQPELNKGEGPIAVLVAPTRELAEQIHKQARIFSKPYGLKVCAGFGGLSKYDQFKELKSGSEVVVATPGRLIDLIKMKACTMRRATYLVFDEADRMFDMGFEGQVRSIMGQIRPDRQTLLFSATMPGRVERLARDALTSPTRITVGVVGAANEDVRQVVEITANDVIKYNWLFHRLQGFVDEGDVLIFANQKARVDAVVEKLKEKGFRADGMHGDMDQYTRMDILKAFREGKTHVLVATDVAARGLDIRSIKSVINFDCAKDVDGHVHRIGRTGRAGDKDGTAYTLITPQESRLAGNLVQLLTAAGQEVTRRLHELAMKDGRFNKNSKRAKGKSGERRRPQVGGAGLGFGSKITSPSLNASTTSAASLPGFTRASTNPTPSASQVQITPPKPPPTQTPNSHYDLVRSHQAGLFRRAFVSSGITGGDLHEGPTVVAPRQASNKQLPPPPTPVTERPIATFPRAPLHVQPRGGSRTSGGNGNVHQVKATPEFSAAFAAAQAIAARLAGGGGNSGSGQGGNGDNRGNYHGK